MAKEKCRHRVLLIGLDGASFSVLRPWMEAGILPHMQQIAVKGGIGELYSTIPPVTGPAWASFMTGMSPGKHGIYDFVRPLKDRVGMEIVSYRHIGAETIFSILSRYGRKVGVVNMPLTYPVPQVDGFVISGMLTPKSATDYFYPLELAEELEKAGVDYVPDVWWQRYEEHEAEKFLQRLIYCTEQRIKTVKFLSGHFGWDLLAVVFVGTDRIQHALWSYIFPDERNRRERKEKEKVYR